MARAAPRPSAQLEARGAATVVVGGADAARAALYDLLAALLADDADALRRVLAEETVSMHPFRADQRAPRLLATTRREVVVQRLLAAHRVSRLPPDTALSGMVDPAGIDVVPVRTFFLAGVPTGLEAGDLLVRFPVDESAERALLAVASHGRGLIVVRVAPDGARIVGL